MSQTFISLRFEQIERRFSEIETLLKLAEEHQHKNDVYQALCRSAHVLLVSHFEGLYKEVCKDIIDDINSNTHFFQVKKTIFNTHCDFFIHNNESEKSSNQIRKKLWDAFKNFPSQLRVDPFLFIDNKNPTPEIIETILERFGVKNFFWAIDGSDLDLIFEDLKSTTNKLRNKLLTHLKLNTRNYPYTVSTSIYNPMDKTNLEKKRTLWEDFINNFLKERHNIIHGHTLDNPNDHESLAKAKIHIEILIYAYIINLCSVANPLFLLPETT